MHESSRRAIAAAFLANLGIAAAKILAFAVTGAASLLAEAIHSVADTGNQGLLFLGGRRAERPPTEEHQFGFARERYFWSFVVALVLFSVGSVFALVEGVDKLIHPHTIEDPVWAFAVLGIAVCLETFSIRTAIREATPSREGRSWWAFIRETKSPELPVVLLEDFGALIGLAFALVGVALATITGQGEFDAIGSIAIGLLLGAIATVLAIETKSLLIGEAATPDEQQAIRDVIEASPEVVRIIHLRTQHLGPDDLVVAAKLEFAATSVVDVASAIDTVEARLRARLPKARLVYFEPDVYRPEQQSDGVARTGAGNGGTMGATNDQENATLAAVDRFNEAFNRHDVDAVMAAMTDDCVFESTSPPAGERHVGQAAVRAAWEGFFSASPQDMVDVLRGGT